MMEVKTDCILPNLVDESKYEILFQITKKLILKGQLFVSYIKIWWHYLIHFKRKLIDSEL